MKIVEHKIVVKYCIGKVEQQVSRALTTLVLSLGVTGGQERRGRSDGGRLKGYDIRWYPLRQLEATLVTGAAAPARGERAEAADAAHVPAAGRLGVAALYGYGGLVTPQTTQHSC